MRFTRHIGIDHAFSFPTSYMQRYGIESWDQFLDDFMRHRPTADPHTYVDFLRDNNPRTGDSTELRLCEQWTAGPKSVFHFDVPEGKSVIAEVYPSLFRRRYAKQGRTPDEHDAYCVAAWLAKMDSRGTLDYYFKPPLSRKRPAITVS